MEVKKPRKSTSEADLSKSLENVALTKTKKIKKKLKLKSGEEGKIGKRSLRIKTLKKVSKDSISKPKLTVEKPAPMIDDLEESLGSLNTNADMEEVVKDDISKSPRIAVSRSDNIEEEKDESGSGQPARKNDSTPEIIKKRANKIISKAKRSRFFSRKKKIQKVSVRSISVAEAETIRDVGPRLEEEEETGETEEQPTVRKPQEFSKTSSPTPPKPPCPSVQKAVNVKERWSLSSTPTVARRSVPIQEPILEKPTEPLKPASSFRERWSLSEADGPSISSKTPQSSKYFATSAAVSSEVAVPDSEATPSPGVLPVVLDTLVLGSSDRSFIDKFFSAPGGQCSTVQDFPGMQTGGAFSEESPALVPLQPTAVITYRDRLAPPPQPAPAGHATSAPVSIASPPPSPQSPAPAASAASPGPFLGSPATLPPVVATQAANPSPPGVIRAVTTGIIYSSSSSTTTVSTSIASLSANLPSSSSSSSSTSCLSSVSLYDSIISCKALDTVVSVAESSEKKETEKEVPESSFKSSPSITEIIEKVPDKNQLFDQLFDSVPVKKISISSPRVTTREPTVDKGVSSRSSTTRNLPTFNPTSVTNSRLGKAPPISSLGELPSFSPEKAAGPSVDLSIFQDLSDMSDSDGEEGLALSSIDNILSALSPKESNVPSTEDSSIEPSENTKKTYDQTPKLKSFSSIFDIPDDSTIPAIENRNSIPKDKIEMTPKSCFNTPGLKIKLSRTLDGTWSTSEKEKKEKKRIKKSRRRKNDKPFLISILKSNSLIRESKRGE